MHLACLPVRFSSYHPKMYAKFSLFIGRLLLTSSGNCRNLQQLLDHQQAQLRKLISIIVANSSGQCNLINLLLSEAEG